MKRADFLKLLGIGVAAAAIIPKIKAQESTEEKTDTQSEWEKRISTLPEQEYLMKEFNIEGMLKQCIIIDGDGDYYLRSIDEVNEIIERYKNL